MKNSHHVIVTILAAAASFFSTASALSSALINDEPKIISSFQNFHFWLVLTTVSLLMFVGSVFGLIKAFEKRSRKPQGYWSDDRRI